MSIVAQNLGIARSNHARQTQPGTRRPRGRPPLPGGALVEELARYYAASRFYWTAGPGRAALIGAMIGMGEIGTRTFDTALFAPDRLGVEPLIIFSAAIPIRVSLSVAFYAVWSGRWQKTIALHALINGIGSVITRSLAGEMTVINLVWGLAAMTAPQGLIGVIALWRMRSRDHSGYSPSNADNPVASPLRQTADHPHDR